MKGVLDGCNASTLERFNRTHPHTHTPTHPHTHTPTHLHTCTPTHPHVDTHSERKIHRWTIPTPPFTTHVRAHTHICKQMTAENTHTHTHTQTGDRREMCSSSTSSLAAASTPLAGQHCVRGAYSRRDQQPCRCCCRSRWVFSHIYLRRNFLMMMTTFIISKVV